MVLAVLGALLLGAAAVGETRSAGPRVLVTGATGRTGALLYLRLKKDPRVAEVRALVRGNATRVRQALGCGRCDASEGIFYGDVTNASSLICPARGVDTLAIAVGAGEGSDERAVEFGGVENQLAALAQNRAPNGSLDHLRVVLCSSAGTTDPVPAPFKGGSILFWKLNAEAFLGASGVGATVVKPCGLLDGPPGRAQLVVGHDDAWAGEAFTVARADVAAIMAEAVVERSRGLRFALCNGPGLPGTDLAGLLNRARWPWEPHRAEITW